MSAFEELAIIYDNAINWSQRLERELPFLRSLLKVKQNARILDLACGSGRHAVALGRLGFDVLGLDLSSQMISVATKHADENGVNVSFVIGDMSKVVGLAKGPFDLIFCLGNSLALLPNISTLKQTLMDIKSLLTPKGLFVAQVLNFQEIRHSGFRFFPLKEGRTQAGETVVFARFFEPIMPSISTKLVFAGFIQKDMKWEVRVTTSQILQLDKPTCHALLKEVDFSQVTFHGDYDKSRFSPLKSRTLIFVATH